MTAIAESPRVELREYQIAALEAIKRHADLGVRRQLLSLPTGLGKTTVFASIPDHLGLNRFDVLLAIAHTEELIDQAVGAFTRIIPGAWVDVEKADRRASPMAHVVVGSVQTLKGPRLKELFQRFAGRIAILVVDEAHHTPAKSYRTIIDALFEVRPDALLLGVTATPRRSDNVGLDAVYERFVYHMDIRAAIDQGYLVPIEAYRIDTQTSLEGVKTARGDYALDELARAVDTDERNEQIVQAYQQRAAGKSAIAFTTSVAHARRLADRFTTAGYPAAAVWGDMGAADRATAFREFRSGAIRILTNMNLVVEGVDVPGVECVIMARPTKSGVLYTQELGRGLRPHEAIAHLLGPRTTSTERRALIASSAKPSLTVLDLVDITRRHELITLPSLFGLPPRLDPRGRRITEVVDAYTDLATQDEEAAKAANSIDDVVVALKRVDVFAVPRMSPELQGIATLQWRETTDGVYRLTFPPRTSARTRSGERITYFDARLRSALDRARRAGHPDIRSVAYAELNVEPESVQTQRGCVELRADALNGYEVWRIVNGEERLMKTLQTRREEVFSETEAWIRRAFPDLVNAVDSTSKRNSERPTTFQKRALKALGMPADRIRRIRTKGDASRLLDRLKEGVR